MKQEHLSDHKPVTALPPTEPPARPAAANPSKSKLTIHELTSIAMMTAVLALMAHTAFVIGPVPVTLQTAGLIGVVLLLPRKNALITVLVYILLGLVGLPVFSAGRSGLAILAGPSGGFIWGFIPGVLLGGPALGRAPKPALWRAYLAAFVAVICCSFSCGTLQFTFVQGVTLRQAFFSAALPFIPPDIAKIALFTPLFLRIRQSLHSQFPQLF